ncbi:MAG: hypothetical protein EOP52_06800 [Sphingobacteriales bacterium]|nr:MAG: hypothetical protein EOP52_06800 [Sphingobacteriales bacterium]
MAVLKSSFKAWNRTGRNARKTKAVVSIDLTAMVDLGLLVLTFFMWMEFLSKPKTITLLLPVPEACVEGCMGIRNSAVLTLLLGSRHQVYYYSGTGYDPAYPPVANTASLSPGPNSLRDVLLTRKAALTDLQQTGQLSPRTALMVLIKPAETCTYEDLINTLDEMAINNIRFYGVQNLSDPDKTVISGR